MSDIRVVDFHDPRILEDCLRVQKSAFPDVDPSIIRDILFQAHPETVLLGRYDEDRLIGLNGFLAHSVCRDGEVSTAYQSCISATDSEFRGRGVFTDIINAAKVLLKERGGAFIFGYPNANSGPIFAHKLGFHTTPMATIDIPGPMIGTLCDLYFDIEELCRLSSRLERCVNFDARETADWKRKRYGDALVTCEHYTNYLFGRMERRRAGPLDIRILKVGGYEINKPPLFRKLLEKARAQTGAHLIRISTPVTSQLASAARIGGAPSDSTEPLITWPLNWETSDMLVEAWIGLKDVY